MLIASGVLTFVVTPNKSQITPASRAFDVPLVLQRPMAHATTTVNPATYPFAASPVTTAISVLVPSLNTLSAAKLVTEVFWPLV